MLAKLFEEQVKNYPERLAVKTKCGEKTYASLNQSANQLARKILEKCPNSHEIVALIFEHGPEMIIGTMGALKAGKTYVPLDPNYPEDRLVYILQDSEATTIITNTRNAKLAEKLKAEMQQDIQLINIETIPADTPQANLDLELAGSRIAYLLYTSGSTGRPKGIIQTEENVRYFIDCYTANLKLTAADRLTLFSAFSHDAAVMDIFGALLNGAALYPMSIKEIDFPGLATWLIKEKITIYHSVPTVFRYFLQALRGGEDFHDLRFIILGGEGVLEHDVTMFQKYFPANTVLMNLYGQSESSYNSSQYFTKDAPFTKITLGEPNDGTEFVVVNEDGEEVAELEVGEIIVVNNHVALGYWKDGERTEKAFGAIPEVGRFYRTGDLGRVLLDGRIEFVGRKDFQVKIRGYRVELGEIESQLLSHVSIKAAVVVVKADELGNKFLCAFVTLKENLTPAVMREFLLTRLPDYMVPAQFITLEAIPTTPNGKTDRKALTELAVNLAAERDYVAPGTEVESKLTQILAEILGIERVGVTENFFELGLHSLKAISLMGRIYQEFHVQVSLQEIFTAETVRNLAQRVENGEKVRLDAITPLPKQASYEVSYAQKRLWYINQLNPESEAYHILGRLSLPERVEERHIRQAVEDLIIRHEGLRTHFAMAQAGLVQIVAAEINCPLEVCDLTHLPKEAQRVQAELVFAAARRPFNLEVSPLFRVKLIKYGEAEYELIFAMHHIISDGWSLEVLKADFNHFYQAAKTGQKPALAPLLVQYKDFAAWQNKLLADPEKVAPVKAFWAEQLSGKVPVVNLPVDYSRAVLENHASAGYYFVIPAEVQEKLKAIARGHQVSLFMVLLAGFVVWLARLTGESETILGIPAAGRDLNETRDVIGFFVNNGLMKSKVDFETGFGEQLAQIQAQTLKMLEYQRFPMEMILEEINVKYPTLSVFFNMLNMGDTNLAAVPDLTSFHSQEVKEAKFELVLYLLEYANGVGIHCHYLTGLFKPATVEYFMGEYVKILQNIANDPVKKLKDYFTVEKKRRVRFEAES